MQYLLYIQMVYKMLPLIEGLVTIAEKPGVSGVDKLNAVLAAVLSQFPDDIAPKITPIVKGVIGMVVQILNLTEPLFGKVKPAVPVDVVTA